MVSATVTLYTDIGIQADYSKSMLFNSKTEQNTWFNSIPSSKKKILNDVNYNKIENSFRIHEEIGDVYKYTYVRIQELDNTGRVYYGFITNVELIDTETSQFDILIDVIQTFMCEWELGECLVAREHVDRWDKAGRPAYVTPNPELVSGYNEVESIVNISNNDFKLGVIAFTWNKPYYTVSGEKIDANHAGMVMYGVVPLKDDGVQYYSNFTLEKGNESSGVVKLKIPTFNEFARGSFISRMGVNPESIIGSWIVNTPSVNFVVGDSTTVNVGNQSHHVIRIGEISVPLVYREDTQGIMPGVNSITDYTDYAIQVFSPTAIKNAFVGYRTLHFTFNFPTKPTSATLTASDVYEPMLYQEPYRTRGICNSNGMTLIKEPDNVFLDSKTGNTNLIINTSIATNGTENILTLNNGSSYFNPADRQSHGLIGCSTIELSLQTDIISNDWLSYCLTQRDSDRKVMQSAMLTNTITNMVGMGYGGALVGSRSNSGRNDAVNRKNKNYAGNVKGYGRGLAMAMGAGVATAGIMSVVQGYDMWVQQQAKENSIKNQPSQLLSTSSGFPQIYDNNLDYYKFETKIDDVNYTKAYNNFRKYGYLVNRIEVPDIKSRYYYNYICTLNTTINGSLSANIKQEIVDIFEKGITFFHADHCTTTEYPIYENIERSLL